MPTVSRFISNLYCQIYSSYTLHKKLSKNLLQPDWPFVLFWNLKSLSFTCCYSFSFFELLVVIPCQLVTHCITGCHSLSFVVTLCHSLSLVVICCHSLSFLVSRCHSLYNSLLFVVTCSHSLSLVVPFVVTRCTTRCHSMYHSSVFL